MRKSVIVLMAFFVSFTLKAQKIQRDTIDLNLDKAIKIALKENLSLKMSQIEVEKKREKIKELQGSLYPQLSVSGQYIRNVKKPVFFMPANIFGPPSGNNENSVRAIKIGADNSYNAAVRLNLPLFALGIYKSIDLSKADLELYNEKYKAARIDLIYNVQKAFYNVLLTKKSYNVMLDNYQSAKDNYNHIKNLYNQGIVSEYDVIRAKVRVENLKPTVEQLENAYGTTIKVLKIFLNINVEKPVIVNDNLISNKNIDYSVFTYQKNLLKNNSDLKQLDLQTKLVENQIELTKTTLIPSLAAFGNYQYQTQAEDYKFNNYNWITSSAVGLQLNIPIFSGLSKRRQIKQAELSLNQVKLQRKFTQNSLELQVQNILDNMKVAVEKIKTTSENVKLAEKGYAIAKTRYNTGQGTLLEMNDAQVALMQARLGNIQAKFDYLNAKIEYSKTIGNQKY